jgi:hypothetical protein
VKLVKSAAAGRGRTRVRADVYRVGPDLLVVLGGEGQHLGAVSMAETAPGEDASVATVGARGHKEPELTEVLSRAVCAATGRRTVVVAGIHLDRITRDEIESIRRNVRRLVPQLDLGG